METYTGTEFKISKSFVITPTQELDLSRNPTEVPSDLGYALGNKKKIYMKCLPHLWITHYIYTQVASPYRQSCIVSTIITHIILFVKCITQYSITASLYIQMSLYFFKKIKIATDLLCSSVPQNFSILSKMLLFT